MSAEDSFLTIKFVELVEKYPCLYDSAHPDHRKRDRTEKVWREISYKMKNSVAHCKEKWKNLRTAFARSIKQPPTGTVAPKKARDYYLKDVMQFILPYMKTKSTNDNLPNTENDSDVIEEFNDITSSTIWNGHDSHRRRSSPQKKRRKRKSRPFAFPEETQLIPSIVEISATEPSDAASAKKQKTSINATNDVDHVVVVDPPNPQQTSMRHESNPDCAFLDSLLPDIGKMSDYQKRQFKRRTLDIIDSILCDGPPQSPARSTLSPPFVVIDSPGEDNKNLIELQPNFIRKFSS